VQPVHNRLPDYGAEARMIFVGTRAQSGILRSSSIRINVDRAHDSSPRFVKITQTPHPARN